MGHGITSADGMLSVIETPWHRLGTVIPNAPTTEEAIKIAGLDWLVSLEPLYLKDNTQVDDAFCTVRENDAKGNGRIPLGVVGSRYTPLQNSEAFAVIDPLLASGIAEIETCGSLFAGRKIWVMAKLKGDLTIADGDSVIKRVLLSSTHDGSGAVTAMITGTRVVCNNTLTAALGNSYRKKVKDHADRISVRHTKTVKDRTEAAVQMLETVNKAYSRLEKVWAKMAEVELPPMEQVSFIHALFPEKEDARNTTRLSNHRNEVAAYMIGAPGQELASANGTLWGALNGITYMTSHKRTERKNSSEETHLDGLWFGRGKDLNDRAMELSLSIMESKGIDVAALMGD